VVYNKIIDFLLPDVLQRTSPAYTKMVRAFSKRVDEWMNQVLRRFVL
jgi:hypothetical protein